MIVREDLHSIDDARILVSRCVVPSRAGAKSAARKSFHREDWCIARFVLRQVEAGLYTLPISCSVSASGSFTSQRHDAARRA